MSLNNSDLTPASAIEIAQAFARNQKVIIRCIDVSSTGICISEKDVIRFQLPPLLPADPRGFIDAKIIAPEFVCDFTAFYQKFLELEDSGNIIFRAALPESTWEWYHLQFVNVYLIDGQLEYSQLLCENVTDLQDEEPLFESYLRHIGGGDRRKKLCLECDISSDRILRRIGSTLPEITIVENGRYSKTILHWIERTVHENDQAIVTEKLSSFHLRMLAHKGTLEEQFSFHVNCNNGEIRRMYCLIKLKVDTDISYIRAFLGFSSYVEQDVLVDNQPAMLDHDPLTGLYSKLAFSSLLEEYVASMPDNQPYAVAFLDIDNYLILQATYGRSYSDALLKNTAETIQAMFGSQCLASRIQRDEFAIFIPYTPEQIILEEQFRDLCAAMRQTYGKDDNLVDISASLGIVMGVSNDAVNFNDLRDMAETAVLHSKISGGNAYSFYRPNLLERSSEMQNVAGVDNSPDPDEKPPLEQSVPTPTSPPQPGTGTHHVFVRAFGFFEVFVDGNPINFKSKKSKELFALMIDRRGGFVTAQEAITYLWEDSENDSVTFARYRKVAMCLRETLEYYGISDILENTRGIRRIISEKIECDYYNYLSGDVRFRDLFRGAYMSNYSWAEDTLAGLWDTFSNLPQSEKGEGL